MRATLTHCESSDLGALGPQVSNLHKNTSSSFSETCRIMHGYHDKQGRPAALLSDSVWEFIRDNAAKLDAAVDYKRDQAGREELAACR